MPNDVSDAFHAFLNTMKADLSSAWDSVKAAFNGALATFLTSLEADIKAAGPDVLQIVSTAVLAIATGGTSAFNPAMNAALAALEKEGIVVAEHVVSGLVSAVIANLPTPSVPSTNAAA